MGLCVWPWNRGACNLCAWRASSKFILVWRHTDLFFNIFGIMYINLSFRNKLWTSIST
jgi:hypothetical protein